MIIVISGQAGSGKSTTGRFLAEKLGYKHYSIGELRRETARKRGMTLAEFNRLGEKDPSTDREVDELQKKLGSGKENFVIDGRTGFHFIPKAVKVYLKAGLEARARRVFKDERVGEHFSSPEEVKKALKEREASDQKRYKKYYGIDLHNKSKHDIVIDTTKKKPEKVVEEILDYLKKRGLR